ncbi:PEPxxWA-CTERM sorting domain-containing protein [Phenylobacterium sp.]|uniref:PEPxxWA-CTERM sorting domain-containing protein n=1 Tax=Phenylobacterium sp. TaxID=1871053 RepID=UPI0025F78FDF|nr:PEPxxWA-CTERM sorting domain-containing protein [Phenylobacterium sp.]
MAGRADELRLGVPFARQHGQRRRQFPTGRVGRRPRRRLLHDTVSFNVLDNSPTGVGIAGGTNASGQFVGGPLTFLSAQNLTFTKSASVELEQGEWLAFFLNNGGNYSNDSTGFSLTLTRDTAGAVPEPGAWALMILGFGLAGAAARGRRAMA